MNFRSFPLACLSLFYAVGSQTHDCIVSLFNSCALSPTTTVIPAAQNSFDHHLRARLGLRSRVLPAPALSPPLILHPLIYTFYYIYVAIRGYARPSLPLVMDTKPVYRVQKQTMKHNNSLQSIRLFFYPLLLTLTLACL